VKINERPRWESPLKFSKNIHLVEQLITFRPLQENSKSLLLTDMKFITDWPSLTDQGTRIVALEYHTPDRIQILEQFYCFGQARSLPVFIWNSGYSELRKLVEAQGQYILQKTDLGKTPDILQYLLEEQEVGIYLLEGVLKGAETDKTKDHLSYHLLNAYHQATYDSQFSYWVFLETYVQLPLELQPFIPVLSNPLPDKQQVKEAVVHFCHQHSSFSRGQEQQQLLILACQGLPLGEIKLILPRLGGFADTLEQLAQLVLEHKINKLRGRGLEYIAAPDVPTAAGLEQLEKRLEVIAALLKPEASQSGLKFPTGMVLWGPPGTGKSLSAKLAAQKMGLPLLMANWGILLGSANPDRALKEFIALVTSLAPCVLYWDDFDKGFAGWDSNADGGIARRLSAALLTWMQEHIEPVYTIATVNRLGMLPAELVRRFDDIFFVDLPHEGARYEILRMHLAKYFPVFREGSPWTDDQWRRLLIEYRLCTPAEISNAVRRCAEEAFYQGCPGQIEWEDLLRQRQEFTPLMERESEQMQAIRNQATYAKSASGADESRFAYVHRELFE
jgi:hypothetical protein